MKNYIQKFLSNFVKKRTYFIHIMQGSKSVLRTSIDEITPKDEKFHKVTLSFWVKNQKNGKLSQKADEIFIDGVSVN